MGPMNLEERKLLKMIQLYSCFPRFGVRSRHASSPSFLALLPKELIDERLIPYLVFEPTPLKPRQHGGVYDGYGRLIIAPVTTHNRFRIKDLGHVDMCIAQWLHERLYLV